MLRSGYRSVRVLEEGEGRDVVRREEGLLFEVLYLRLGGLQKVS